MSNPLISVVIPTYERPDALARVNAVLRRVAATPMVWSDEPTRLSYPDWIVDRLLAELGPIDGIDALERMNALGFIDRAELATMHARRYGAPPAEE